MLIYDHIPLTHTVHTHEQHVLKQLSLCVQVHILTYCLIHAHSHALKHTHDHTYMLMYVLVHTYTHTVSGMLTNLPQAGRISSGQFQGAGDYVDSLSFP
jgi:hypothetical protein